jgi:hypothetical protein
MIRPAEPQIGVPGTNTSGKATSCAPCAAAWPVRAATRPRVAAWSIGPCTRRARVVGIGHIGSRGAGVR